MKFLSEEAALKWLNEGITPIYWGVTNYIDTQDKLKEWKIKWQHDMDTPVYRFLMDKMYKKDRVHGYYLVNDLGTCLFFESSLCNNTLWLAKKYIKFFLGPTQRVDALHIWDRRMCNVYSFAKKRMDKISIFDKWSYIRQRERMDRQRKNADRSSCKKQKIKR